MHIVSVKTPVVEEQILFWFLMEDRNAFELMLKICAVFLVALPSRGKFLICISGISKWSTIQGQLKLAFFSFGKHPKSARVFINPF